MMVVLSGDHCNSSSDRKCARFALFSPRARKFDQFLGSGTELSSIARRMGQHPFARFFLVTFLIEISRYLSNVTSAL